MYLPRWATQLFPSFGGKYHNLRYLSSDAASAFVVGSPSVVLRSSSYYISLLSASLLVNLLDGFLLKTFS